LISGHYLKIKVYGNYGLAVAAAAAENLFLKIIQYTDNII